METFTKNKTDERHLGSFIVTSEINKVAVLVSLRLNLPSQHFRHCCKKAPPHKQNLIFQQTFEKVNVSWVCALPPTYRLFFIRKIIRK